MKLWNIWFNLVKPFQQACSRKTTFFWLVIVLIGFTTKTDFLGVTSLARGAGLLPNYYTCLLNFFGSPAIDSQKLLYSWLQIVINRFNNIVRINNRLVVIADGIKVGKEGKKMPGIKWLHQDSASNSKAEYIMGHSIQAISLLAKGVKNFFAVPITAKIHEGIRLSCKDNRTILDKLVEMLLEVSFPEAVYLIADKYYCSGRLLKQLVSKNIHIVTMMKKNSVAYYPAKNRPKFRGRPRKYADRVKLFSLFNENLQFIKAPMPNKPNITIEYFSINLLWRLLGNLVQFVFVKHPQYGNSIFMSTDLTINPLDMILAYSLRFKIEVLFKQAIHQIGTFTYRFWLKLMKPRKRGKASGDFLIHFSSKYFKERVENKIKSYHLFIQLGLIAQGLIQYISIHYHQYVWGSFGSWLRTIRDDTLPSEKVVSIALSRTYMQFLIDGSKTCIFRKFLFRRTQFNEKGIIDDKEKEVAGSVRFLL